jgi:small-conductance mechanosensitive channel
VESIGLRITTVRTGDGALRAAPNGQITELANHSAGGVRWTGRWSRVSWGSAAAR